MTSGGKPGAPTRLGGSGQGTSGSSANIPAAGSSTDLAADGMEASLVGEVLDGRYRVLKKLGEGGMGEVYAAEHIHIEKKVAIKLLRPEIVSNQEAVSRFRQEARSASSIGHRNIIGIDDFGQLKDGRIYLCMELLAGAPLNDMIKAPMPDDRLLNILIQTGHGLAAAHAKNIVHRDMKPENIFVTVGPSGEDIPKLLDFGIAKVAGQDGQNNLTRTGTIFGTPYYMAPEQALGQSIDARVDVYAMGVIMYEVFAGSLPFQGESFMGILTQHITTDPEPVAQRAMKAGRSLPAGMPEVITRCLAKDPEKRFRSMDELVNALIGVYRSIAGSGMSSYMEAYVPKTGMMPAAGAGPTGQPMGGAASAPTMIATGSPTAPIRGQHPTPQPMHPMHGQHPMSTPQPQYGSGPYPYPDGSQVAMPPPAKSGSKVALIAVLVILVVVGGGVAAVLALSSKKDNGTEPAGAIDAAGEPVAALDAGAVPPPDIDAAGQPAADIDAGAGPLEIDAGSVDAVEPVTVMIHAPVRSAVVYLDGKKLGKVPQLVKVKPGETYDVVVKAKGYKDFKTTVDGHSERVDAELKATGGGSGHGPGPGTRPPGVDCEADPLNPACAQ